MTRLVFVVEGRTEEMIANRVLVPHLAGLGVYAVASSLDGGSSWAAWRRDLKNWMLDDATSWFTTMFDLYRLPKDTPGRGAPAASTPPAERAAWIEAAIRDDLGREIDRIETRLIPYLQVHELEALVLAGLDRLAVLMPESGGAIEDLAAAVRGMPPEDVNDRPDWAPSKRLLRVPGYDKVLHGPLVIEDVGIAELRRRCPRFGQWLSRLETLGG